MDRSALYSGLRKKMAGAIENLEHNLNGLRTGRASANLLDKVIVEAYGDKMPLNQLGTVSVPEPRMITVQVWDKAMVKAVEKAIANANLGVNPAADGNMVRVPMPPLSEQRRNELCKIAHDYGEQAKISSRNIRRDGMEEVKKAEKEKLISEDDVHVISDEIQKITDECNKKIEGLVSSKQTEIKQV